MFLIVCLLTAAMLTATTVITVRDMRNPGRHRAPRGLRGDRGYTYTLADLWEAE